MYFEWLNWSSLEIYADFHPLPVQELYGIYENILWSYDILWSLGPNTSPTHLQTNGGWKPMVFPRILVNSPRISKPLPPVALLGSSWWFRWGKWLSSLSENEVYNPSGHVNMENIGKWWFTSEFRGSLGSRESHILMNQMFVGNISY